MTTRKFRDLRKDLYERSPSSRTRVAETVERLNQQLGLAELRSKRSRTQAELAKAIGTTQSAVSRVERQQDLLVSTLEDFVAATGGHLRLVADYGDYQIDVDLPVLHRPPGGHDDRMFRVIWQNLQTRQFVHVGWLLAATERFAFNYTPDAELDQDFEPFQSFPDLRGRYESEQLFPFFADRVASAARGSITQVGEALGLAPQHVTPLELLARSWGQSPHDTIQVVPEPDELSDGTQVRYFLVSGARHVDEDDPDRTSRLISALQANQELTWREEPDNPINNRAIRVETNDEQVGWMPDYLLDELHKAAGSNIRIFVEHANGPTLPWHLRLLCRLEVGRAPSP